jgi:hypothetical protein
LAVWRSSGLIREIEAVLKIARVEIGIAELAEQAGLVGEGRLENNIRDPAAQIAIRVNTISARIELANASRQITVQPIGQKGAANRPEVACEAVGQKA